MLLAQIDYSSKDDWLVGVRTPSGNPGRLKRAHNLAMRSADERERWSSERFGRILMPRITRRHIAKSPSSIGTMPASSARGCRQSRSA